MKKGKLIYILDPHCGWCYGNTNNIVSLREHFAETFDFELLVGGMWLGKRAPFGGEQLHRFISTHAPRLSETTGMTVGKAYYVLTSNPNYQFSSLEASAAVTTVKAIEADKAFPFMHEVFKSLFQEGKRYDQPGTYLPILDKLGIAREAFLSSWMSEANLITTHEEFRKAQTMASGFPTLCIQIGGERPIKITSGYFHLDAMMKHLASIANQLTEILS